MKRWIIVAWVGIFIGFAEECFAKSSDGANTFSCFTIAGSAVSFDAVGAWESKYVSVGRNQLDKGGIYSFDGSLGWKRLSLGAWFATGDRVSYEELDVSVDYTQDIWIFCTKLGYNRLEFLSDHATDNEFSAQISYDAFSYLVPTVYYVYATENAGGALEASLVSSWSFFENRFSVEPYVLEGFDFGYSTKEFDGENNFQVGVECTLMLSDHFDLVGSLAHSWALKDIEKEHQGDLSWESVGLSVSY